MKTVFIRLQNIYVAAAALLLTAMVVYLTQYGESGQISITPGDVEPLRHAESFLLQPSGTKYGRDGDVVYRWQADTAERQRSGEIVLADPFYTGLGRKDREWTAEARRGRLAADGQSLQLTEDVVVRELLHAARIDTQQLLIDLEDDRVSTDDPVEMEAAHGRTTAVGLRADLARERLVLLNNVKGQYEISR